MKERQPRISDADYAILQDLGEGEGVALIFYQGKGSRNQVLGYLSADTPQELAKIVFERKLRATRFQFETVDESLETDFLKFLEDLVQDEDFNLAFENL